MATFPEPASKDEFDEKLFFWYGDFFDQNPNDQSNDLNDDVGSNMSEDVPEDVPEEEEDMAGGNPGGANPREVVNKSQLCYNDTHRLNAHVASLAMTKLCRNCDPHSPRRLPRRAPKRGREPGLPQRNDLNDDVGSNISEDEPEEKEDKAGGNPRVASQVSENPSQKSCNKNNGKQLQRQPSVRFRFGHRNNGSYINNYNYNDDNQSISSVFTTTSTTTTTTSRCHYGSNSLYNESNNLFKNNAKRRDSITTVTTTTTYTSSRSHIPYPFDSTPEAWKSIYASTSTHPDLPARTTAAIRPAFTTSETEQIHHCRDQIQKLCQDRRNQERAYQRLGKEVHHQKFVDLEERIRQLEGLLYDLQLENQQFQAENEEFRAENERFKTHIQDLQLENQQFQAHIQALQMENQQLQTQAQDHDHRLQQLEAEPQIVHAIAEPILDIVETNATAIATGVAMAATDATVPQ